MTDPVRLNTSFRVVATEKPVPDPGDYSWRAMSELGEAHAFPPVPEGRLPGRSACDLIRWSVAVRHGGAHYCRACVAKLRDDLRAITVALYTAGICTDVLNHRAVIADYDAPVGAGEDVEASRG